MTFSILRSFNNNNNKLRQNYSLLKRFFCNKEKHESRKQWNSIIGLEIHSQIISESKLFSGANVKFGGAINSCVSFFDCATPGTLPVLNKKCVEAGVITALALSCKINEISLFDRKHYFYSDLPAGYQITQQQLPLAINGEINFPVFCRGSKDPYIKSCKLKQIQLEQDSGKTIYDDYLKKNLIDLNRAGIPLLEFVFEPNLNDGEEAAALVKELILMFQRLNTCSYKMDEGGLRVDANVSINKPNEPIGVRTEVKNIGSIRGVASAIKYEIERQINICEKGGNVVNETRSWNDLSGKTISMREKENYQDYRFMPEPNLPPLHIHIDENSENKYNFVDAVFLNTQIPEMPQQTRNRLATEFNIPISLIIILLKYPELLEVFKYIIKNDEKRSPLLVAKILTYDLLATLYKNKLDITYCFKIRDQLCDLVDFLQSKKINFLIMKTVLDDILKCDPDSPVKKIDLNNWTEITDNEELRKICKSILDQYPDQVAQYKKGKKKLWSFFIKRILNLTNQRANKLALNNVLNEILK